jgi:hypothetical protein
VIRLLQHLKTVGDVPWRNSARLLKLDEIPEFCLGYGGNTTRGRDVATDTQKRILSTAKEIIDLGVQDPELFSLVGLLEEGVGPDTIGDMTAHAILPALVEITVQAAKELSVKVRDSMIEGIEARLPQTDFLPSRFYLCRKIFCATYPLHLIGPMFQPPRRRMRKSGLE